MTPEEEIIAPAGPVAYVLSVTEYFTEMVRLRAKLGEALSQLEAQKKTLDQVAIVAETERSEAQKQLEQANRYAEDFTHVVSHDLKAPLRGIVSLSQWLQEDYAAKLDSTGKEHLRMMVVRSKRMNDMIDGLLRYSRLGHRPGEQVRLNLKQVVKTAIDQLALPAHITVRIGASLPDVTGDADRLSQLFQSLIRNAVQFIDKPQGTIQVTCVTEEPFFKFCVTDNGPGIAAAYHEKIFQLFQTLAPKDLTTGTGVGLAVAKKVVESYGGRIWVESEPGRGSAFFFTLPLRMRAPAEAAVMPL